MRKKLFVLLFFGILLLFMNLVSAEIFSTIATQGLSFVDPKVGAIVSNVVCVAEPLSCVSGKIVGVVQGKVLQEVAKQSPAAAQAIQTYEQVKGYTDKGAQITKELSVDDKGQVVDGTLQFNDKTQQFGNLVGKDIPQNDISGKQVELQKKDSLSTVSFTADDSFVKVKNNEFTNIKKRDVSTQAYLQLNDKGDVTGADFTTNDKGGTYVFGNDKISVSPNSRLQYSNGEINIAAAKNSDFTKLPSTIENSDKNVAPNKIIVSGENIKFPNDNVLQNGNIVFDKGKTYIGDGAQMDNLQFSYDKNFKEQIFFDGRQHADAGGDYISLNAAEKRMYLVSKEQDMGILNFNKGNPFVAVAESETFDLRTSEQTHNLELGITNPPIAIPQLAIQSMSGSAAIDNGKYIFFNNGNNLLVASASPSTKTFSSQTTPVDLKFQDTVLLSDGKDLIVNKDNSYGIIRESNPLFQQYNSLQYQNAPVSESQQLLINKIQKETPWITYEGIDKVPLAQLQQYDEVVTRLPGTLTKATTKVTFDSQTLVDTAGEIKGKTSSNGDITLAASELGTSPETMAHEFTHALDNEIRRDPANKLDPFFGENALQLRSDLADQLNSVLEKNDAHSFQIDSNSIVEEADGYQFDSSLDTIDKISALPENVQNDLYRKLIDYDELLAIKADKFDQQWLEVQRGREYFLLPGVSTVNVQVPNEWNDGTNGPRNGFVRAYGSANMEEDKATFVEQVDKNPAFFKSLIDPKSSQYDPRYLQKLELLEQNKFITPQQFQEVLRVAR